MHSDPHIFGWQRHKYRNKALASCNRTLPPSILDCTRGCGFRYDEHNFRIGGKQHLFGQSEAFREKPKCHTTAVTKQRRVWLSKATPNIAMRPKKNWEKFFLKNVFRFTSERGVAPECNLFFCLEPCFDHLTSRKNCVLLSEILNFEFPNAVL